MSTITFMHSQSQHLTIIFLSPSWKNVFRTTAYFVKVCLYSYKNPDAAAWTTYSVTKSNLAEYIYNVIGNNMCMTKIHMRCRHLSILLAWVAPASGASSSTMSNIFGLPSTGLHARQWATDGLGKHLHPTNLSFHFPTHFDKFGSDEPARADGSIPSSVMALLP